MSAGAPISDPLARVRHAHGRRRAVPLLYATSALLFAVHATAAESHGRWPHGDWVALAAGGLGVAIMVRWLARQRRETIGATARAIDARLHLQSRCEAACELAHDDGALAVALRADVGRRLDNRGLPGTASWYAAAALLFVTALLATIEVAIPPAPTVAVARMARARPTSTSVASPSPAQSDAAPAPTPAVTPVAAVTLQWLAPARLIEVAGIEEVALVIKSSSVIPVGAASLPVSVNGTLVRSIPLTPESVRPFTTEDGRVEATLYLDDFPVQDGDVVAYRLEAMRSDDPGHPLASPTQFILVTNLSDPPGKAADLARLKALRSLGRDQISLLAEVINGDATAAPSEAAAPARRQHELAQRVQTLRDELGEAPSAQPLSGAVWQMRRAENHIANREPAIATDRQYGALEALRASERLQREAMRRAAATAAPKLPERRETPAGKIEEAAKQQEKIAEELGQRDQKGEPPAPGAEEMSGREGRLEDDEELPASKRVKGDEQSGSSAAGGDPVEAGGGGTRRGPGASGPAGKSNAAAPHDDQAPTTEGAKPGATGAPTTPTPDQAPGASDLVGRMGQVTRNLQDLQEGGGSSQRALQQAIFDSNTAVQRSAQGNTAGALEPALAAAMALNEVSREQERAGRAAAQAEFESVRRDVNRAARGGQPAGAVQDAANRLEGAAHAQQQFGSAAAAETLLRAATALRAGRAAAADTLAQAQAAIGSRSEALAQTARRIARARAQLGESQREHAAENLELAAQLAASLLTREEDKAMTRRLASEVGAALARRDFASLDALAEQIGQALVAELATMPLDQNLQHFDRAAVAPEYRAAVDAYFEALTRRAASSRPPARQP